jgi:hypothetical protein
VIEVQQRLLFNGNLLAQVCFEECCCGPISGHGSDFFHIGFFVELESSGLRYQDGLVDELLERGIGVGFGARGLLNPRSALNNLLRGDFHGTYTGHHLLVHRRRLHRGNRFAWASTCREYGNAHDEGTKKQCLHVALHTWTMTARTSAYL